MDTPIVPGCGSGRSPVHQLIAKLFEAESSVAVDIPGANGELESTIAHLTEGLITLQGEALLDIETYHVAPEFVRDAHKAAFAYLNEPIDAYADAWEAGVRALYPVDRAATSFRTEQLGSLRAAHPVYEPIVDAVRAMRASKSERRAA